MHWHLSVWKLTFIYDCYQISTSPATAVAVCHQGWSWVIIFTEEKAELSSMSHCLHLVSCYKRQFWTSPLLNTELETKVSENTCLLLRHVMSSFPFILKLFTLPTWWKKKKKIAQATQALSHRFLSQGASSQAAVKCMLSCQTENNFLFLNNKTCIYYRYCFSHLRNIFMLCFCHFINALFVFNSILHCTEQQDDRANHCNLTLTCSHSMAPACL